MTPKPTPAWLFRPELRAGIRTGRKRHTRRVITRTNTLVDGRQASKERWADLDLASAWVDFEGKALTCPDEIGNAHVLEPRIQPGDVKYLREPLNRGYANLVEYADDFTTTYKNDSPAVWLWKLNTLSSMLMPAWAARTFIVVERVWPERIQSISEVDAMAEGAERGFEIDIGNFALNRKWDADKASTYRLGFKHLWDSINAPAHGWAINEFLWAHAFHLVDPK